MKLKELKHNHSLTDLLKVLIFSILMITPLLSVATRCLYVICNKNAYQSAEITQTTTYEGAIPKYESNEVNTLTDLVVDNVYSLNTNWIDQDFEYTQFSFYFNLLQGNISFNKRNYSIEIDEDAFYSGPLEYQINVDQGNMTIGYTNAYYIEIILSDITFDNCIIQLHYFEDFMPYEDFNYTSYNEYNAEEITIESTTLDNVFEYSVNKLAESPILSWTQQTAIYTGVSTMTTQLGVNTPTIPMLIVYWFLLTVIYIIIDIIIKLFTWLTHMIGSKSV